MPEKDYWILVNATPDFKEGEPTPFQVFTTFEEITERKNEDGVVMRLFGSFQEITS